MATVDAVIVSYNSGAELRGCAGSLLEHDGTNVIVVDNDSPDRSLEVIADLPVTRIQRPDNPGFGTASNDGMRRGDAPFVLFLNPDARLDPASLGRLVEVLRAEPATGVVGPRITGDDGALHHSLRRFARLRSTYARALFLHRLLPRARWTDELIRDPAAYERRCSPEWISGACLLVRRSVLEQVGGFDERFFLYREDMDLCRRIRDAGWDVRFEPAAHARHEGGASGSRAGLLPVLAESRIAYARKHHGPLVATLERAGIALEAATHAVVCRGGRAARRGHLRALRAAVTPT